jgi:hypothetical protein
MICYLVLPAHLASTSCKRLPVWFNLHPMTHMMPIKTIMAFALATTLALALPVRAQMGDVLSGGGAMLEQFNESKLDRFGKPTFGLRAQREPELRRLRKMAGRPILEGRVSIYDLSDDEIDDLFEKLNTEDTE